MKTLALILLLTSAASAASLPLRTVDGVVLYPVGQVGSEYAYTQAEYAALQLKWVSIATVTIPIGVVINDPDDVAVSSNTGRSPVSRVELLPYLVKAKSVVEALRDTSDTGALRNAQAKYAVLLKYYNKLP